MPLSSHLPSLSLISPNTLLFMLACYCSLCSTIHPPYINVLFIPTCRVNTRKFAVFYLIHIFLGFTSEWAGSHLNHLHSWESSLTNDTRSVAQCVWHYYLQMNHLRIKTHENHNIILLSQASYNLFFFLKEYEVLEILSSFV